MYLSTFLNDVLNSCFDYERNIEFWKLSPVNGILLSYFKLMSANNKF